MIDANIRETLRQIEHLAYEAGLLENILRRPYFENKRIKEGFEQWLSAINEALDGLREEVNQVIKKD